MVGYVAIFGTNYYRMGVSNIGNMKEICSKSGFKFQPGQVCGKSLFK